MRKVESGEKWKTFLFILLFKGCLLRHRLTTHISLFHPSYQWCQGISSSSTTKTNKQGYIIGFILTRHTVISTPPPSITDCFSIPSAKAASQYTTILSLNYTCSTGSLQYLVFSLHLLPLYIVSRDHYSHIWLSVWRREERIQTD